MGILMIAENYVKHIYIYRSNSHLIWWQLEISEYFTVHMCYYHVKTTYPHTSRCNRQMLVQKYYHKK